MDEALFYKRLEKLEENSIESMKRLERLSSLIEIDRGNVMRQIEAIYKIIERHDRVIFGDGEPGLITKIETIKDFKKDHDDHVIQDRWCFGTLIVMQLGLYGYLIFR